MVRNVNFNAFPPIIKVSLSPSITTNLIYQWTMREQKILNLCAALVIPPVNGRELFRSSIKWLIKPENASKCAISRCFSFKKFSKKKFDDFENFF